MKSNITTYKKHIVYLWLFTIFCTLIFVLPITHRIIAQLLAVHSSTPYERWLRRLTEYAYRPFQCITLIPLIFYYTLVTPPLKNTTDSNYVTLIKKDYPKHFVYFFLIASTIILLSILTTSSPLYPFNPWNDADIIYTVGKAMAKGMVPYRDLFERKGILLYFIHAVGYMLTPDSFNGLYIIECISCFFFLYLVYKTARLYTSRSVLFIIPVFAAILYAAYNKKSGDSAEELCLPLLLYPLYISVKNIKQGKDFSNIQLFFCGLCAGCIFWIKYSMLGFFLGWIIIPIYIYVKNKRAVKILLYACIFLAGITVTSIPWILYFGANHAISDWASVYFLDNILWHIPTNVKNESGLVMIAAILFSYIRHIPELIHYNFHVFFLALLSLCYSIKSNNRLLNLHLSFTFITTYLLVLGGGSFGRYYCMPLEVFFIFSVIPIHSCALMLFQKIYANSIKHYMYVAAGCIILTFSIIYAATNYTYIGFMTYPKEQLPQYKFARIIKESGGKTMLSYKFMDRGFYIFADILPDCRYFFEIGLDPEYQIKFTEKWVADGKADFLVTSDTKMDIPGYSVIAEEPLYINYGMYLEDSIYYLYRRNGL